MLRIVLGMIIGVAIGAGATYRLMSGDPAREAQAQAADPRQVSERGTSMGPAAPRTGPPLVVSDGPVRGDGRAPVPGIIDRPNDVPPARAFDPELDASVEASLARLATLTDEGERYGALQAAAGYWALRETRAALDAVDGISQPAERSAYLSTLVRTLAESAPESLVARFADFRTPEEQSIAISALMNATQTSASPQRLLGLTDQLPPSVADSLRQNVLRRWALVDPMAALAYAQAMPLGQTRESALNITAMTYATKDPQGALAWLEAQTQRSPSLEMGVFSGIAQGDPARAVDLLLASDDLLQTGTIRAPMLRPLLMNAGRSGGTDRSVVADRLMRADNTAREQLLPAFLQGWSLDDPRGALSWLSTQGAGLGDSAYAQVAAAVASQDVALAAEFASRLPADARRSWIASVGQVYASRDPEGAIAWLGQYSNQPGYAEAALGIAQVTAAFDPARAAELVASVDSSSQQAVAAASVVAMTWSQSDPAAARRWAVGLPSGRQRDAAMQMLVANVTDGSLDTELLGLFSTEQARMQAAFNGIIRVAAGDPTRAHAMLEQYVPDPATRARYTEALENMPNTAFGIVAPAGMPLPPTGPFMRSFSVGTPTQVIGIDQAVGVAPSR